MGNGRRFKWGLSLAVLGLALFLWHKAHHDFFTIVVLPDTQKYSQYHPEFFYAQTDWIVNNRVKERIVFVTHLGDIVQNGDRNPEEWEVAQKAMSHLDDQVPWGIVAGNHDFDRPNDPAGIATKYLEIFGPQRFEKYPWFGEASDNGLNTYQIIQIGKRQVLAIHLEPDVPDEAIEWAEGVIARYPNLPVMLTTHIYMDDLSQLRQKPQCRRPGNSGHELWEKFISKHAQIFMVLCGHYGVRDGEATQIRLGDEGKRVIQMISDYQRRPQGGGGLLRLIRVYPMLKKMKVRTYSPVSDSFETDHNSQFTLPLDLSLYAP